MGSTAGNLPSSYEALSDHPLWGTKDGLSDAESIRLGYQRAKIVGQAVQMSVEDIVKCSPKFWDFHSHLAVGADSAATTLLVIHWNLCMGTMARYAKRNSHARRVLGELERFEAFGGFMLTELGHGLDAQNIETTATLRPDGAFELNTPRMQAAKMMGPTSLHSGMRKYAVVFARPVVQNQIRNVKPFLVKMSEPDSMTPGIESRLMPPRPGANRVDHCMTTFNHVLLGPESLLGPPLEEDDVADPRADFALQISRVPSGTLSLSTCNIPMMRLSGYIAGRYSQKRQVVATGEASRSDKKKKTMPIIRYSTQYGPILKALAYATVLDAYAKWTTTMFSQSCNRNPGLQAALACVFKATATQLAQPIVNELIDRCGWQGLYAHNQIIEMVMTQRGNSIAEGDCLVLCIRLVSELLQNRVQLPPPTDPDSLLARHEAGVWAEIRALASSSSMTSSSSSYRTANQSFNTLILPQCRSLVQSIGLRMAYEAFANCSSSSSAVVPREILLEYFEATAVADHDPAWYVENASGEKGASSRVDILSRVSRATEELLPFLDQMLEESGGEAWATAKFLGGEDGWGRFVGGWERFGGGAGGCGAEGNVERGEERDGKDVNVVGGGFERLAKL